MSAESPVAATLLYLPCQVSHTSCTYTVSLVKRSQWALPVVLEARGGLLRVQAVAPDVQPPDAARLLRPGDAVLAVEGVPVASYGDVEAAVAGSGGPVVRLRCQRASVLSSYVSDAAAFAAAAAAAAGAAASPALPVARRLVTPADAAALRAGGGATAVVLQGVTRQQPSQPQQPQHQHHLQQQRVPVYALMSNTDTSTSTGTNASTGGSPAPALGLRRHDVLLALCPPSPSPGPSASGGEVLAASMESPARCWAVLEAALASAAGAAGVPGVAVEAFVAEVPEWLLSQPAARFIPAADAARAVAMGAAQAAAAAFGTIPHDGGVKAATISSFSQHPHAVSPTSHRSPAAAGAGTPPPAAPPPMPPSFARLPSLAPPPPRPSPASHLGVWQVYTPLT
jgi:hypothetical protein